MGVFFGTDGIRGEVNQDLNYNLAISAGNALGKMKKKCKIVIGGDTRVSRDMLAAAFSLGATLAGADVINVGIMPTPAIAYITRSVGADYGVVISASHNPAEFNGIKIFDEKGHKLGDKREDELERKFISIKITDGLDLGSTEDGKNLTKLYEKYLMDAVDNLDLSGLKIVIDGANGAAYKIAPKVFRELGAKVITIKCKNDGKNINKDCGSLHIENLSKMVRKYNANIGFAFDGDADRLIAVDEKGRELDGDALIYIMAIDLKEKDKLKGDKVVITTHSNSGLKDALWEKGIDVVRVDIGDKYVTAKLLEENLSIGGEKSGHILINDKSTTGDGVLNALLISKILKEKKLPISKLMKVDFYPQVNIDIVVSNKLKILNSEEMENSANKVRSILGSSSRVMIRASGTEPKVRVMIESRDENAKKYAEELRDKVLEIENKFEM